MTQSPNHAILLIVDDSFALQLLQERADIGANFFWIGGAKFFVQFRDEFAEGALAVATFEHLTSCALQLDGAFGKQDHAVFFRAAPAAAGGKTRLTCVGRGRHVNSLPE